MVTTPPDVTKEIAATPLLAGLPHAVIDDLLASATVVRLRPHETVFDRGDPGNRMFILISGKVKVTRPGDDGRDNVFTIIGPGDLLGELSMFDGTVRLATATAVQPSVLACVPNERMLEWLERSAEASRRFMFILIKRIRLQNDALDDMYGLDVGTRVARAIIRLCERFGRTTAEGKRVDLGLNQEEIALHVRASRESVNQVLSSFARSGWLRREGTELIILDEASLQSQARYRRSTWRQIPSA